MNQEPLRRVKNPERPPKFNFIGPDAVEYDPRYVHTYFRKFREHPPAQCVLSFIWGRSSWQQRCNSTLYMLSLLRDKGTRNRWKQMKV